MSESSSSPTNHSFVRLYLGEQGYFTGLVTSMTTAGLIADFPIDNPPNIPARLQLELALSSDRSRSSLRLPAKAIGMLDDELRRRYEFAIEAEAQMALGLLIDGRNECRVAPNLADEVLVMLRQEGTGAYAEGTLDDVSRTGLALYLSHGYETALVQGESTRVSFVIPGQKMPIQLLAYPRNVRECQGRTRLGLQLEYEVRSHRTDVERYLRYVDSLKDDLLRHLSVISGTEEAA